MWMSISWEMRINRLSDMWDIILAFPIKFSFPKVQAPLERFLPLKKMGVLSHLVIWNVQIEEFNLLIEM